MALEQTPTLAGQAPKPAIQAPKPASQTLKRREGFALVTVILVLAALLLLCTPFMLAARNADQASQQLFHKAQATIALDNASTHARAMLERSHPSFDTSMHSDSLAELEILTKFTEGFLNAQDPKGVMWDVRAEDVAGKIDLGSAPPQLIAAMLGSVTRLAAPLISKDKKKISMASVKGFDPSGYVWIEGELIRYEKIVGNTLTGLVRGYGSSADEEDNALPGPLPASDHGVGATVLEQRAYAPAEWRLYQGKVRSFDSEEQLQEIDTYTFPEQRYRPEHFRSLAKLGSTYGGVGAGAVWQRAARMTSAATAQIDDSIWVDSIRWFSPGSTVRIKTGTSTELALVRNITADGRVELDRGLRFTYAAFEAEVSVLARRPVNINTARPEVLQILMQNLSLASRNQRIDGGEARALTALIIESRPFSGPEDFLKRLVLPAAGLEELPLDAPVIPDAFASGSASAVIEGWDAVALYRNALNANDVQLKYSTMPFSFTSNDVYDLSLRAVINGKSGVARHSALREETQVVIPQEELRQIFTTQADWDESLRLSREAPYWSTGPEATSRLDPLKSQPPTRMWAHMGTFEGEVYLPGVVESAGREKSTAEGGDAPTPEHVFADRESADGFAQLFQHTVDENADPELRGHMMHFTHDTSDREGRYFPDGTIKTQPTDETVEWDDPVSLGMLRTLNFSCWIKPQSLGDAYLLDVGGNSTEVDRVSLLFEEGDLVLRCLDGGGDHKESADFTEAAEVRYALTEGEDGPGLPIGVWSHVEVDVRGARPDQMTLLVNGLAHGVRNLGMSRLAAGIGPTDTTIPLESGEGFPMVGVARIGDELIEYTRVVDGDELTANFNLDGTGAGFGGRNARRRWRLDENGENVPEEGAPFSAHMAGTTVQAYGYSLRLQERSEGVKLGKGSLPSDLGKFRVGIVSSVVGGNGGQYGEEIAVPMGGMLAQKIGTGIKAGGNYPRGLELRSAERPDDQSSEAVLDAREMMSAFNRTGGYACLMQSPVGNPFTNDEALDSEEYPIGGWSVIRYTGYQGTILDVAEWGSQVTLENLNGANPEFGGGERSFVVQWQWAGSGGPMQDVHGARLFIMPISIPTGSGSGSSSAFLQADVANIQFAQITDSVNFANTEWVAYNSIQNIAGGQLVRDDPEALARARRASAGTLRTEILQPPPPPGPQGPSTEGMLLATGPILATLPNAAPQGQNGLTWEPTLGVIQDEEYPVTRAVREAFQFRGVMRTFSHPHNAGSPLMPVFRAEGAGVPDMELDNSTATENGRPGRFDKVFVMAGDPDTGIGWPMVVSRAHLSDQMFTINYWTPNPAERVVAMPGPSGVSLPVDWSNSLDTWFFTFEEEVPAPVPAGGDLGDPKDPAMDSRLRGRMTAFPSGERPRNTKTVTVGSAIDGTSLMNATVDEITFGSSTFGGADGGLPPESYRGAQMVLMEDLNQANTLDPMVVLPRTISLPMGLVGFRPFSFAKLFPDGPAPGPYLSELDEDGGLLRVGEEILAYEGVDSGTGTITLAPLGRGLLGTVDSNHEIGERVSYLDGFRVAILSTQLGDSDATIRVSSTADFPSEGTLLIGSELIHYTRFADGGFDMPRLSGEAGKMDERGGGIFRGRFGTTPEAHSAGEPVILFPFRYWDRWEANADGPELAYFGLEMNQPSAFWRSFSFEDESVGVPGSRMGVLMRTDKDVPWDADPETTKGLELFFQGDLQTNWIGHQAHGVEWRVFVDYEVGAFDEVTGSGHGWRTSPRLKNFIVDYMGPASTLRSVDR